MVFLQREEQHEAGNRAGLPTRQALHGPPAPPAAPRHSRVHALAAAAEHDIRRLLGLLLLLEQSHRAQRGVAGAHLLQELQEEGRSAQGGSRPQATSHPSASRCGSRPRVPGHPPPPRPASSSAALSSSCLSLSRGSGGTAAGKPGDTGGTSVITAACVQGAGEGEGLTRPVPG